MIGRTHATFLLVLLFTLGLSETNAETYAFGGSYTNTTGTYTLELDPYGMTTFIEEYKDNVYLGTVYPNGTPPTYNERTDGSHVYVFYNEIPQECELGTCWGGVDEIGRTYVTVDLPPPPSTPGTSTFTYLSHASINSDKDGSFTVNWTASTGNPTRYELQQRLNSGTWGNVYTGTNTSKARSVGNGTYDYRVRACNDYGCSSYTAYRTVTVIKTPSVPGAISAPTTDPDGGYGVSWGASSGTVTKYTLQENINSGTFSTIQDNSYLSRSLSGKTSAIYGYRVRACNSLSCSGWTSTKSVTVSITPGVPSSISLSELQTDGTITVSWGASSGPVDAYRLYREKDESGTWSHVYTGLNRSWNQPSLANGNYRYRVRGCNTTGSYTSCSDDRTSSSLLVDALSVGVTGPSVAGQDFTLTWRAVGADYSSAHIHESGPLGDIQYRVRTDSTSISITKRIDGLYSYYLVATSCTTHTESGVTYDVCEDKPSDPTAVTVDTPYVEQASEIVASSSIETLLFDVDVDHSGHLYAGTRLDVPKGVNGLEPGLSLSYKTDRRVDYDSPFKKSPLANVGYGWSFIGIEYIEQTATGLYLNGTTELVSDEDSGGGVGQTYRLINDASVRLTKEQDATTGDIWFSMKRGGRTYRLGATSSSRKKGYLGEYFGVTHWYIEDVVDEFGNQMTFDYIAVGLPKDARYDVYPWAINYGGYRVEFTYGHRQDANINGNSMLVVNHVRAYVNGIASGEYRLAHEDVSGVTRFKKLQYCGFDTAGQTPTCTQPVQFDWIDLPQDSAANKLVPMVVNRISDGSGLKTLISHVHESDAAFWSSNVFAETPFVSQAPNYVEDGLSASNYTDTPTWMVSSITRSSGINTLNTTEYAYNNVASRTSAMRRLLPDGTYLYSGSFANTALFRRIRGRPTNQERWTGIYGAAGSSLLSKSYTHRTADYLQLPSGGYLETSYVCRENSFKADGQGNLGHGVEKTATPTFDATGLITSRTTSVVTGQIADDPPARLFTYGSDGFPVINQPDCSSSWVQPTQTDQVNLADTNFTRQVTSSNFTNDQTSWLIGFLSSETTSFETIPFGSASTTVTVSRTQLPGTLRAESVVEMAGTSGELTTSTTFDAYGNPTSATHVGANVSSRTQHLANYLDKRYPQTITNALGHTTTLTYDTRFGAVESVTDPNNLVTRFARNKLGRVIHKTLPNGTTITSAAALCSSCPTVEGMSPRFSTSVAVNHASAAYQGAPDSLTYHDAKGRIIRKQTEGFAGESIKVDTAYDDLGRIYKESTPYTATPAFNVYHYDLRNRTIRIDHADGSTTQTAYADLSAGTELTTTQTIVRSGASKTQSRFEQYNLLGQLINSVDGYNSLDAINTEFRYDEIGSNHWTQINNDSKTVVTTSFDITANQRSISDPNTGTTTFVMDALGQVIQQTDASGKGIDFDYDLLGRLTTRTDDVTGTAPITNTFTYDTRTNGIGLLASRSNPGFIEDTYYTSGAQVGRVETNINVNGYSDSFVTSFTYDYYGRTASQTYPSGLMAYTDYNSYGYAYQLRDGNNKVLSRSNAADHFGNPTQTTLGNGLITTRTYDSVTGAITGINTDSGLVQDNSYSWWSNGTLHQRSKGSTAETLTYDVLNRVKTAASTSSTGRTLEFNYDKLGNLTSKTSSVAADVDVTGYSYTGDGKPHRLNTALIEGVTHTYSYDDVGNIVASIVGELGDTVEDRSIVYNAFGKPTQIRKGDAATPTAEDNFYYGPNGFRFYKHSRPSDDQTLYLYGGVFEVVIPATGDFTAVEKSYLGDVIHYRDVTLTGSTERYEYVHTDHLGSVQVITDEAGYPVPGYGLKDFDPFGGYRTADWSQDEDPPAGQLRGTSRGFTGHEHLDDTGLVHMNGRVYDPELGRFMSADPIVQAPEFSQSYNRYAYVFNGPLSFTDPSGYSCTGSLIDDSVGCVHNWSAPGPNANPRPSGDSVDFEKWLQGGLTAQSAVWYGQSKGFGYIHAVVTGTRTYSDGGSAGNRSVSNMLGGSFGPSFSAERTVAEVIVTLGGVGTNGGSDPIMEAAGLLENDGQFVVALNAAHNLTHGLGNTRQKDVGTIIKMDRSFFERFTKKGALVDIRNNKFSMTQGYIETAYSPVQAVQVGYTKVRSPIEDAIAVVIYRYTDGIAVDYNRYATEVGVPVYVRSRQSRSCSVYGATSSIGC